LPIHLDKPPEMIGFGFLQIVAFPNAQLTTLTLNANVQSFTGTHFCYVMFAYSK